MLSVAPYLSQAEHRSATSANATMRQLHERMQVILEPTDWPTWLGEDTGDAMGLMRPAADHVLHL